MHHHAPERVKNLIFMLALIRSAADTVLSVLPNELLFLILELIPWTTEDLIVS